MLFGVCWFRYYRDGYHSSARLTVCAHVALFFKIPPRKLKSYQRHCSFVLSALASLSSIFFKHFFYWILLLLNQARGQLSMMISDHFSKHNEPVRFAVLSYYHHFDLEVLLHGGCLTNIVLSPDYVILIKLIFRWVLITIIISQ